MGSDAPVNQRERERGLKMVSRISLENFCLAGCMEKAENSIVNALSRQTPLLPS